MAFITKEAIFSAKWFKAYALIITGTFIMAVGFVLFISPYKFAPGGVYGIAIVLHHLFGFKIGLTGLAIDIPLTIFGIWMLGPRFGAKTITGMLTLPAWMTLLEYLYGYEPFVADQPLLSAIYGGVLVGLGLGMVFKSKATSGGSDIIAMVIGKYTHMPLGQLMIYVDSAIVLISWVAFKDPMIPLISWVIIFITGKVIDIVLEGMSYDKTLFIISDKHEEIGKKIVDDLKRGGTYFNGVGAYNGNERTMIFTVLNRREMTILMSYINDIDPNAFVTVVNANEVLGDGFRSLKDKVED
ncbi:MAG: membrane protein [Bacteroidetes bacterium 4572_112]|nr:MAG: membrane protein [Bacteroidetes bacterium 4572_112]